MGSPACSVTKGCITWTSGKHDKEKSGAFCAEDVGLPHQTQSKKIVMYLPIGSSSFFIIWPLEMIDEYVIVQRLFSLQHDCKISNACFVTSYLLQQALEKHGYMCRLVFGTLRGHGLRLIHCWVEQNSGNPVDATYFEDLPLDVVEDQMLTFRLPFTYQKGLPDDSDSYFAGDKASIPQTSLETWQNWQRDPKRAFWRLCKDHAHIKEYVARVYNELMG